MVDLVLSIPAQLSSIAKSLNVSKVTSRNVCRGTYCISCDGTPTCLPTLTVTITQGSKYGFNVQSIPSDTLVTMVLGNSGYCSPTYTGVPSEYMKGSTFVISSVSGVTKITLTCATNTALTNSIPISGTVTTKAARRRLLDTGRRLTQLSTTPSDAIGVSLVVPTNQTSATQDIIAASNMTLQGFIDTTVSNLTVGDIQCPINSTSPIGSTRLTQCYCLPGYRGNASLGTPCSPCGMGEYCSGGIMGLCPPKSTAPPLSNSSSDCVCDLGFYGPTSNCQQCPVNSYCMGGRRYNCTANAVSAAQSANPQSCFCKPGLYGSDNQPCQPCQPGFWCSGGASNACPMNWTSNANSSRIADCYCKDGFESVSTRDTSGNAINICQACANSTYCKVCSPPVPIYNMPLSHIPECER